jgi:SAM-dependent methyltransferase
MRYNNRHKYKPIPPLTMASSTSPEPGEEIRPFEWLTSASSLDVCLTSALQGLTNEPKRVLHVGSGSSVLGEYLLEEPTYNVGEVVNADINGDTIRQMKERWEASLRRRESSPAGLLTFLEVDLCSEPLNYPSHSFDMVLDKSTLDCTLCSDDASAGLLTEIYRLLKPEGGVYLLISFNHIDLLLPLLQDCPGVDWEVTHSVVMRQSEDLASGGLTSLEKEATSPLVDALPQTKPAWSSGAFEPDESYRKTVNVLLCRRSGNSTSDLDREAVDRHIIETNDQWFKRANPMLTSKRREELYPLFQTNLLDLPQSFQALFTESEREHLTFDYFLEDWHAFLEKNGELPVDRMSFETAARFLDEMQ